MEGSKETSNLMPLNSCDSEGEREHMFEKVVTPSDVGKLNRLVIPKQQAEKYFPLDSISQDKGLLLNFEDRSGKPWRFRYSYWNSSQSYVMTKGWSRFVKDKNLHAGDIVSFHRAHANHRLFIDWRHRPHTPLPAHNLYSMAPLPHYYLRHHPHINYNYNYHNHPYHRQLGFGHVTTSAPNPVYLPMQQLRPLPMVPLLTSTAAVGKNKLRLFGVNMECPMATDGNLSPTSAPQFPEKGKSSLSFDLDLQT